MLAVTCLPSGFHEITIHKEQNKHDSKTGGPKDGAHAVRLRKNNLSTVYHNAKKECSKAGNTAEQALAVARQASKDDSVKYDAEHAQP